jgi:two-component system chemotaxis response regulator CheY
MPIDRAVPVLIVERRRTFSTLIESMLNRARFQNVESTYDGESALDILRRGGPKIIIADLHMGPMTWFQMLQQVRGDQHLAPSPFIITADVVDHVMAKRLKDCGVDGLLLKPFKPDVLEPKLSMAFQRAARFRPAPDLNGTPHPRKATLGSRLLYRARKHAATGN